MAIIFNSVLVSFSFFLVEMQIPIGTKHHFAPGPAVCFRFRGPAINVQKSKKETQQQTERKDHDKFQCFCWEYTMYLV